MLNNEMILLALLVIAVIFLVVKWLGGDPTVESPRSQMNILEELLRNRGFKSIVPVVRDFERYNEHTFLEKLQEMMIPFSQDGEFIQDWLGPILIKNLSLIVHDEDLLRKLDLHLRREYGYEIRPIRHVEYGLKPHIKMRASAEEQDVHLRENTEVSLERGHKAYFPLETVARSRRARASDLPVEVEREVLGDDDDDDDD